MDVSPPLVDEALPLPVKLRHQVFRARFLPSPKLASTLQLARHGSGRPSILPPLQRRFHLGPLLVPGVASSFGIPFEAPLGPLRPLRAIHSAAFRGTFTTINEHLFLVTCLNWV